MWRCRHCCHDNGGIGRFILGNDHGETHRQEEFLNALQPDGGLILRRSSRRSRVDEIIYIGGSLFDLRYDGVGNDSVNAVQQPRLSAVERRRQIAFLFGFIRCQTSLDAYHVLFV